MQLGIVGGSILFGAETKRYATPTSIQCHCNIVGATRRLLKFFIAGVRGWEAGLRRLIP
jgi:hypothetical protein